MVQFTLYVEKNTFLHKLDPRAKLIWLLSVWIWAMVFNNPIWVFFIFLISIAFGLWSRSLGNFGFAIYGLISLFIMSALMWPFFRPGFTVIYVLYNPLGGTIPIHYEGVLYGLAIAMRLFAMIFASLVFFATTRIEDLEVALTKMNLPYGLVFGISTIFRFIPTMYGEAQLISSAQEARGVDLTQGSLIDKAKNAAPMIAPLFVTTLRRAGELIMAVESRGFLAREKRTSFYEVNFGVKDAVFVILSLMLLFFFVWLRLQGYGLVNPNYL